MTTICPPVPRKVGEIIHFEAVATGGAPPGIKYKIDIRKRKDGTTIWSSIRVFYNIPVNQLIKYDYAIPITDKGGVDSKGVVDDICYYKVNVQYLCPTNNVWKVSTTSGCKFKII